MLLLVIALFLVCWGPRLLFNVIVKLELQSYTKLTYTIRVASHLLSFIHSALNPFVYGLMSSTFRNIVFKSCAGKRRRTRCPDSCGASGRLVMCGSGKLASGTWAVDELVDDDVTDTKGVETSARHHLLDLPSTSSLKMETRQLGHQLTPDSRHDPRSSLCCDPRERSSSQATVVTVAPIDAT